MNTEAWLEFMRRVRNPQAWTGLEINAVRKAPAPDDINVCLVFPDTYEIGMSHQGIKILYHQLNAREGVAADRCFLPEPESTHLFADLDLPLFSIEQRRFLREFDVLGFSLLTEFSFTGLLQVLDLAGMPLKQRDRDASHPLVVAGGISVVNPEPLREFVDAFAVGDGELLFPDILAAVRESRNRQEPRSALLERLSAVPGVYVPSRVELQKHGRFLVPSLENGAVYRRSLARLEDAVAETRMIVPLGRTVFERLEVEIARGCPQTCRFCQARSYYAPWRPRPLEDVSAYIAPALKATGFEAFSLSSLSAGDYPGLDSLLLGIPGLVPEGVSMSVPSLRPATLSRELLDTIASQRRTGITIVPEAGSQRLRRVINKNVTDEEVFAAVDTALHLGWQKLKLYFMFGLPTETDADIDAAAALVEAVLQRCRGRRIRLHASFSAFVPKPHTPLQWAPRESADVLMQRTRRLKQRLKRYRNLVMDFSDPLRGEVETILARGDARAGELLLRAWRDGEAYSAWDGRFNASVWQRHIRDLDLGDILEEIQLDQPLPWESIRVDFRTDHLKKEYRLAMQGVVSPACAERDCASCRGCFHPIPARSAPVKTPRAPAPTRTLPDPVFRPVRLFFRKQGTYRYLSQLALNQLLERLIRRTGMRFRRTSGFHPRIKMAALPPLPVLASGNEEMVEVQLDARWDAAAVWEKLRRDSDFPWVRVQVLPPDSPGLSRSLQAMVYAVPVSDPHEAAGRIEPMLEAEDRVVPAEDHLEVWIGSQGDGAGRFARIYRALDPERSRVEGLQRLRILLLDPPGCKEAP